MQLIRRSIFVMLLAATCIPASAQTLPAGPQVSTFFSNSDDTEQPYALYVPKNYDANKKYPLVVMLHGAGSNHRLALRRVFGKSNANGENDVEATLYFPEWKDVDYVVASTFARGTAGYQGIIEKDVYDMLADVKKKFNIDDDRTYLTGLSMGGGGTLWIGLTRPDIWAALAPVCPAPPRGSEYLQGNAIALPMHFFHGDVDRAVPVTVSRDWTKRIKELGGSVEYDEYPGVDHNSWENAYKDEAVFDWFGKFKRNLFPDRVLFNSMSYQYNKAYWVHLDQLIPGTLATIDAKFTAENQLEIVTTNLNAFTLSLQGHSKFNIGKPVQITINGKKIKSTSSPDLSFSMKDGKWIKQKFELAAGDKKQGVEGPISAAFAKRHIYVYGTSGDPSPEELKVRSEAATQAANWSVYRNSFLGRIMFFPRVVSDKEVRPSDLESSDLILFGTKETNSVISQLADKLPLHMSPAIKDVGLFYVFPVNGHYVAVSSGLPWWTSTEQPSAFSFIPSPVAALPAFKDFILFKNGNKSILAEGYFGSDWKLTEAQSKMMTQNALEYKP
jgi:predicted esterase